MSDTILFSISNYIKDDVFLKILSIDLLSKCKGKHIGNSIGSYIEGRIPLNTVVFNGSQDSTYKLKSDTLIFKISPRESLSFYFRLRDEKIINKSGDGFIDCEKSLIVKYIDPDTGELGVFSKIIPELEFL